MIGFYNCENLFDTIHDPFKKDYEYLPGNKKDWNTEKYLKKLGEERARDRLLGSTRRGPHRDDFLFRLQERDARVFASEGQQRGLVLSLRLAEFAFLREALGRIPLILADDVLGELDNLRKANFRKLLPAEAQVFATGTSYPSQSESAIWETFEVLAGNFKRI